jgi:hypothetical protein
MGRIIKLSIDIGLYTLSVVFLGYTGRDDVHITYYTNDVFSETGRVLNYSDQKMEGEYFVNRTD